MSDLPGQWRVFKGFSILQMILVTFFVVISISGIFEGNGRSWRFFEAVCYGTIMLFLYHGFTILNDNYPDTPLTIRQKRIFNILFLLNFLLIAFVFAKLINQWRFVNAVTAGYTLTNRSMSFIIIPLVMAILVFVLHIMFMAGMYRLRVTIQQNNSRMIDDDFISDS